MKLKVKDEQILSLRHEHKILENRLKTKADEMSHQKQSLAVSFEAGKKKQESHQSELELKDLTIQKLERQICDKQDEMDAHAARAATKLVKQKERNEATVSKLNAVIAE